MSPPCACVSLRGDRQTEAGAAGGSGGRLVGAPEAFEDVGHVSGPDAVAGVGDLDVDGDADAVGLAAVCLDDLGEQVGDVVLAGVQGVGLGLGVGEGEGGDDVLEQAGFLEQQPTMSELGEAVLARGQPVADGGERAAQFVSYERG